MSASVPAVSGRHVCARSPLQAAARAGCSRAGASAAASVQLRRARVSNLEGRWGGGRRRGCRAAAAAQDLTFSEYRPLTYQRAEPETDFSPEMLRDLSDVTLGLERKGAEDDRSATLAPPPTSCLPIVRRMEKGCKVFELNYDELYAQVKPYLSAADHERLERIAGRYYLERVWSREQLVERCRRIYEGEPSQFWNPTSEAIELMQNFLQLELDHFELTKLVAERAEEREVEVGQFTARHPGQSLPDPSDLAVADVTLYLEFERELLLLDKLEEIQDRLKREDAKREREQVALKAMMVMLRGAVELSLSAEEMALVGATPGHVEQYMRENGEESLPFTRQEFQQAFELAQAQLPASVGRDGEEDEDELAEEEDEAPPPPPPRKAATGGRRASAPGGVARRGVARPPGP